MKYDFCGWATKNNIRCADGRVIMKDAFKDNHGKKVPLVWGHSHDDPFSVLGHAYLENRDDGVYAYCTFNDSESGQAAKCLVDHGDVSSLSIYANKLKQKGSNVVHGIIREVSLVLAGANPEANIERIMSHSGIGEDEGFIISEEPLELYHSEDCDDTNDENNDKTEKDEDMNDNQLKHSDTNNEETVGDVFNTLTKKQKEVVYAIIGEALSNAGVNVDENEGEDDDMKHNIFDVDEEMEEDFISHDDMMAVINDAKRFGSMKESALEHGITDIDYLFPEAQALNNAPDFISRPMEWVTVFMNGVHHTPFSRIKSIHANITGAEARARGYMKGNYKEEEVFALLKRVTTPQTIYKKQKLDRDDVVDITDFDVVSWLKTEMRMMLNEEIARAGLIGDGRNSASDDKIDPLHIRPIWTDEDLYTIKKDVVVGAGTPDEIAKSFIRTAIKARKDYRGSGTPTLFTYEDVLTDMLLLEDADGRIIYDTEQKLATTLRVSKIVTVPVMDNDTVRRDASGNNHKLLGIIVNLNDYNIGADKGGAVNMFDDFDIDYNAQKYLIETRCSGALTKPYSAIAIEMPVTA